jgi:hypothetical protein
MAKSQIRVVHVWQVLENSVCQRAEPRENDFAISIKSGQEPNGIKLASERLLDQLPAQFLSGFNHEREALRSPLFDPRLCPMQADGVDKQRP